MTDSVYEPGTSFAAAVDAVASGGSTTSQAVEALLDQLELTELLGLLDGDLTVRQGVSAILEAGRYMASPTVSGRVDRLGIPGIRFTDGPRGVAVGSSTSFPVAIARAASWDVALETRVGEAIAREARAQGANFVGAICVNLAPFPGWGRTQESYGEDPVLLGAMGAAFHRGASPWAMTCVKHFALNSMEDARFRVDVLVDQATLHEVYLPHFRAVVDAGVDAVMTSYNSVNGQWAGQNRQLLTGILREQWGFRGFVMTDFVWGLRDPVASLTAGQDVEMPFRQQRAATLPRAVARGDLGLDVVRTAAGRILEAQIRLAVRTGTTPTPDVVACAEHRELARCAASLGSVLLRNSDVDGSPSLPLSLGDRGRLAVLGRLADTPNLGDVGSSQVHPPAGAVVRLVDELRKRMGGNAVLTGPNGTVSAAVEVARTADAALLVVGLTSADEGESLVSVDADCVQLLGGIFRWRPVALALAATVRVATRLGRVGGDRRDLRLHPDDVALITAVSRVNAQTVVVVIGGGTIVLDPWCTLVSAILMVWYPGMEGGAAIADMILGEAEPGGRLPLVIPHRREDLPTVDWNATVTTYGRWWGQRHLDLNRVEAAMPFGYGLGYTTFELRGLVLGPVFDETFTATVTLVNTGKRRGRHVVQIYGIPDGPDPLATRVLLGFQPAVVDAGASVEVSVSASCRPLQSWTDGRFAWHVASVTVEAASHSGDPDALKAVLSVP